MANTLLSESPSETKKIGADLAKKIKKDGPKNKVRVLALEGDLGGGKTTFLQGFAKGLGIKEKILSPTFVIMRKFKIPTLKDYNISTFTTFYHIDCYRIQKPREILDLGFKNIVLNPQNIVAIEWPEKIKKLLPKNSLLLKFEAIGRDRRRIKTAQS
jgi:tRNA threonylcarbamoyladenosine biosynthesis protein TsaE